jgi:hypothetical protein
MFVNFFVSYVNNKEIETALTQIVKLSLNNKRIERGRSNSQGFV